ncbi:MAG: hypothetical protein LBS96_00125 [Oscillospiraceae bacterium]|jgi:hypothetical protein|nr:hypothetical protein [Oscillospiraceae bacterium]
MLNQATIKQLKQSNISVDGEQTKQRVEVLWKAASSQQKQTVKALAGVATQTVYRVYNTGSISAKLVVAISQALNVNPFYLTGEAEEPGECSGGALRELLQKHGYRKLLAERELAEKKVTRKLKAEADAADEQTEAPTEEEAPAEEVAEAPVAEEAAPLVTIQLEEEELQLLLRALLLRVRVGVPGAAESLAKLTQLLVG